ncbi:hypothetical protein TNCV_2791341 [Trichonephila clavipes]|nr:hypothetical protein TNCV_2791341 [Trichonephila clavipes]
MLVDSIGITNHHTIEQTILSLVVENQEPSRGLLVKRVEWPNEYEDLLILPECFNDTKYLAYVHHVLLEWMQGAPASSHQNAWFIHESETTHFSIVMRILSREDDWT